MCLQCHHPHGVAELSGLDRYRPCIVQQLLARMHYLPITAAIEDATIAFRQKHTGKLPDAIIAGTATLHQLELLTLDTNLARKAGAEAVSNI
ncbi:PIN domain-containing protein [Acidithiobacillus sp. MC6.1]|nr:PIN domain-containing protein [Acidithiobacillus sp. MC6.1]